MGLKPPPNNQQHRSKAQNRNMERKSRRIRLLKKLKVAK
jgi:hypothetical protein